MAKTPAITRAEWDVMDVIWQRSPIAASDVVDALVGRRAWNPRTVKTLLTRLVAKNALAFSVDGNRYLYRPKVKRDDCVERESQSFLSRIFAGRAGEMLCRFVDEVELTPDEIAQLRKRLDRKGGKR